MIRSILTAVAFGSSFGQDPPNTTAPSIAPTAPPTLLPTYAPTEPSSMFKGDAYGRLSLNSFVPYPGEAGSNVSGYVLLTHTNDTVTIDYKLMGVDTTCAERLPGVENSCGLHIHVGFSCDTDLAVGIHYYDTSMADPWVMGSYYRYDPETQMAMGEISLKYGFGVDASKGHAFVVHDAKGTRIACGILSSTTDKVTLGKFGPYPMYEGPLKDVEGCVHMDFRGVSAQIAYDLAGVDPLCANPSPNIPNSCGLHIHLGMTCSNATEVGDHYFDVGKHYFPSTPMPPSGDPWSAAFVTLKGTRATGTLQVDYGFGFDSSRGRAMVLHDYNGTRVACALIPIYADRVTTPLPALNAMAGYEGPPITGSVQLDFRGDAVKILYNLSGTETMCAKGVPGPAPNSCGIHIHTGLTCAEPGGHYFDASKYAVDPWQAAAYKAGPSSLIVGYGYSFEQTKGRTVVIHNYNGTKVACATIPATSSYAAMVTGFLPLPNTPTTILPSSMVQFDFRSTSVRMTYNLMGVEAGCANHNPETQNSCGLHIHEGTCDGEPGEDFFKPNMSDPWTADFYVATPDGRAMGHIDIEYGYGFLESRGRAVIIYNYAGDRVTCASLPSISDLAEHAGLAKLVPLPGPSMVNTSGTVLLTATGLGVKMDYALSDVEPECASTGPAPLSCGIHIHKGFSCEDPLSHFYNNGTYPQDPWMYASYVSVGTAAYGSVVVSYGESWELTEGRVVVIHNYNGTKIACAVIPQTTDQVLANTFKYLANQTSSPSVVQLDFRANSVQMAYNLAGVDPTCTEPGTAMNSCGLHIHNGTTCADASDVGTHYYDSQAFDTDPWATVVYKSDETGNAMGVVNVEFGYDYAATKGRVVVLHDKAGTKILCAPIPTQTAENSKMTVSIPAIAKYPAYTGPYSVGVTALALEFNGVGTKIVYNLTGVPCECSQMGTAPNSCGLHIHEGTTCLDATLVGGHWFNKSMIANDPWATTTYTSLNCADTCLDPSVGTTATGAVTVDFGYGVGQTLDKVMVVHDYLGNRIACAPISATPQPGPRDLDMTGMLAVSSLAKYPASTSAYGGNMTGGVQLQFMGTLVTMVYRLEGVDPLCVARDPGVPNSCGMHIHSGWSCDAASLVGPHFYQPHNVTDPWQESYYMADAAGNTKGEVAIAFGYTIDESKGRTFVLHDYAGVPMTCSVLGSTTDKLTLGTIMRIPKYAGKTEGTTGCINLDFRGSSVTINYDLMNVDPECINGALENVQDSCGIHIHDGTSCDNATASGGPFYAPMASDVQPWKYVDYSSDQEGNAKGTLNVEFGYGFDMAQGKAFVLHDAKGSVMTCNLIPVTADRDVTPLPQLTRLPSYNGSVAIEGSVKLDFRGHGVKIFYDLTGLEPACQTGPGPNPNSCGIHIHAGFTCEKPLGHFFNSAMYPKDPWSAAVYLAQPMPRSLIVSYGFDYENSKGRTVVVHNYDGAPVACAVIPATTDRATAANFAKIGTTGIQVMGEANLDFRATSVRINYNLQHVDPRCTQPMPGVANSCGLHIHAGMSCEDNGAQTGSHYFNNNTYAMDPWANISYIALDGNTAGVVDVENGYGFKDTKGRAFVLHDLNGNKMACAIISTGNAPRDTVSVVNLMPVAPTPIQGKVVADFQGMGVKLSYNLVGVETNCSLPGDAKLSCGIHIHEGFDCSNSMGHYFNNATYPEDPWMYATYTALGSTARGSLVVSYGEDFVHSMGRALVIHNYAGAKVACQTLPQIATQVTVENFQGLGVSNESQVNGYVHATFRTSSVRMNYLLQKVDPRCAERLVETNNSCGLHIHNGTCASPGGHYYDTPADPWAGVYYVSTPEGVTAGTVDVEFGYGYEMTKGKIIIVHDQAGTKVSCAEIGASLMETVAAPAPMRKYPGYEGLYVPKIQASMKYTGQAVTISYNLSGVPCECSQIGTAPNSCGLHIHEGTSCDANGMVGGHWFNNQSVMTDPWAYTPYTALKCSDVCLTDSMGGTAAGSLTVVYGYDYAHTVSRVLVVHDYMGNRIGCAPLESPQAPTSSPIPWVPILAGGGAALLLLILVVAFCRRRQTQRARVGTLNEKLAPNANAAGNGNPTRRTLSVNRM